MSESANHPELREDMPFDRFCRLENVGRFVTMITTRFGDEPVTTFSGTAKAEDGPTLYWQVDGSGDFFFDTPHGWPRLSDGQGPWPVSAGELAEAPVDESTFRISREPPDDPG